MSPYREEIRGPKLTRWGIVAIVAITLIVTYWLRYVLLPFVIAGAIAFVATPPINFIRAKIKLPRWLIALGIFIVLLAVITFLIWWAEIIVLPQLVSMASNAEATVQKFLEQAAPKSPVHFNPTATKNLIFTSINEFLFNPGNFFLLAGGSFATVIGFFMTLVLLIYFLLDGPRIARGLLWLVPPALRPGALDVGRRVYPVLLRYIAGVFLIVIYTTLIAWIAIGAILRLPHAPLLSVAIGILEIIPVIGPVISGILLALVAINYGSFSLAIGLAGFAVAMRLTVDQVVGPIILGKAVTVHPVVIIFAFLAGGSMFGILGVILAVPIAAVCKVLIAYAYNEAPE